MVFLSESCFSSPTYVLGRLTWPLWLHPHSPPSATFSYLIYITKDPQHQCSLGGCKSRKGRQETCSLSGLCFLIYPFNVRGVQVSVLDSLHFSLYPSHHNLIHLQLSPPTTPHHTSNFSNTKLLQSPQNALLTGLSLPRKH